MKTKANFIFPLPPEKLHKRYDPVFLAFKKGLSATIIGLPQSARSGYLKFILEYKQSFLNEFIDSDIYRFIFIDPPEVKSQSFIRLITAKILSLVILTSSSQKDLSESLKIGDPILISATLIKSLSSLTNFKLVIILYEVEQILEIDPEIAPLLVRLWNLKRNQPNSLTHLCFIGSPTLLDKAHQDPRFVYLRMAVEESIHFFPLFDNEEMQYLRKRLEYFSGKTIGKKKDILIRKISDGHTILYRILSELTEKELKSLMNTHSHPALDSIVDQIWKGIPYTVRQNWKADFLKSHPAFCKLKLVKNGKIRITLLPPAIKIIEPKEVENFPLLSAQQKLLFDYLKNHMNIILSRDEVAQALWGKSWTESYSDWAIDQAIYKLRQKLVKTSFKILAHRNRGYQLIKT